MPVMGLVRHATKRFGFYRFDFIPLDEIGRHGQGRLGDAQSIARNQNGSSIQGSGRVALRALDITTQGLRETVEPVTHTCTSEHAGNRMRADE